MNQSKNSDKSLCEFCGGKNKFLYRMGEYDILKCFSCGTGSVNPFPSPDVLSGKYGGFLKDLNVDSLCLIKKSAAKMFEQLGFAAGKDLEMLDIGGGGGYFSKAFEDLGYGKSTYVDIDPCSCDFASKQLNLKSVINCDALNLDQYLNKKYDFVFSRHLIEHLSQPIIFLNKSLDMVKDGGTLFVQCPNGDSLEYLAYLRPHLKNRVKSICESNNFSKSRVLWIMATGGMLHGIDPPRHLWAITGKAIRYWAREVNAICEIKFYSLSDKIYSPHWIFRKGFMKKILDIIASNVFAPLKGGSHMVAVIRKNKYDG